MKKVIVTLFVCSIGFFASALNATTNKVAGTHKKITASNKFLLGEPRLNDNLNICAKIQTYARGYHCVMLKSVEVGDRIITDIEQNYHPGDKRYSGFSDSLISGKVQLFYDKITISIKNNSNSTLKLIWDDVIYVGFNKHASNVIHSGVRFIDMEKPQTPSTIARGSILYDNISPKNYLRPDGAGWTMSPLFSVLKRSAEPLLGQIVKIILPFKSGDKIIEYTLNFEMIFVEK